MGRNSDFWAGNTDEVEKERERERERLTRYVSELVLHLAYYVYIAFIQLSSYKISEACVRKMAAS